MVLLINTLNWPYVYQCSAKIELKLIKMFLSYVNPFVTDEISFLQEAAEKTFLN